MSHTEPQPKRYDHLPGTFNERQLFILFSIPCALMNIEGCLCFILTCNKEDGGNKGVRMEEKKAPGGYRVKSKGTARR